MKIVNPVGRTPHDTGLNAYGCVCNIGLGNHNTVSGNVPCNVCAYSCAPGNTANLNANMTTSTNQMTHT
ncbi:MAG: hypothetical protein LBC27_07785 [Spirochaetaceae bacterium]|jgi:hypothetical protein|nr:hypothetical protein [Spirochaetaceae bacterium]